MDYFQPLRRKLGVVTLVLACMCFASWVRSRGVTDAVNLRDENTDVTFAAERSGIIWLRSHSPDGGLGVTELELGQKLSLEELLDGYNMEWQFQFGGIQLGKGRTMPPNWSKEFNELMRFPEHVPRRVKILIIPYWLVVIPLTLLSTVLLLSKSKAKSLIEDDVPS